MTAPVDLLASALSDRYRIERELGQGGMATVYLAHDLKHDRPVAIKVLLPELSAVIGADRFLAEIRTTASLQHPHILPLYDSGAVDGVGPTPLASRLLYYVMPFVPGETLRTRLTREKQLPVEDALRLTREVASALDYAHRQGVVHRDIKPENILLQDGQALVADFGIALAVQQAGGSRLTQTGMSLGTPAYMSPEQAMGERDIGPRSDVYALGAMTYEMLAGEPPFPGPNSQAIVAKVLTEAPPPLRARRPLVPAAMEAAVVRALQKLPADRWGSAKAFADALADGGTAGRRDGEHAATAISSRPHAITAAASVSPSRRLAVWSALSLALVSTLVAAWALQRPRPELPPARLAIVAPRLFGGSGATASQRNLAFTPDGSALIYPIVNEQGGLQLVHHPLDAEQGSPIAGATNYASPVVSPDGRTLLANFSQRAQAVRLPVSGGTGEQLRTAGFNVDNASWGPDGAVWFSRDQGTTWALGRLDGDSVVVVHQGTTAQVRMQQVLPDGRSALVQRAAVASGTGSLLLVNLETGEESDLLVTPVTEGRIMPGLLITVLNGAIQAYPFDGRKVTGSPVTIATGISVTGSSVAQFSITQGGSLAYIPEEPFSLDFVNRDGATRAASRSRQSFHHPLFSPDGRRLSVDYQSADGRRHVWIFDPRLDHFTRATYEVDGHDATWTPDGRAITYIASVPGPTGSFALLQKPPASTAAPETLMVTNRLTYTGRWLPDGSGLVTTGLDLGQATEGGDPGNATRSDIGLVSNVGRGPILPLVTSPFAEQYVSLSPDGRWLAFTSNQSDREEVYVRAVRGGEPVAVSTDGGTEPVWSPDGREVFFRETTLASPSLVAARISTSPTLEVTQRTRLFPVGDVVGTNPHANYDISPDGRTFVVVRRSPSARIVVIQNVPALVRKLQRASAPQ